MGNKFALLKLINYICIITILITKNNNEMANLFVFNCGDRPILVETTGTACYDRARGAILRMFQNAEGVDAGSIPSYPTIMAALRKDTVYRFVLNVAGIDFKFSIGTVPRPTSLTDEITEAISRSVESIQRTQ